MASKNEPNLSLYFEKEGSSCFDELTFDGTNNKNINSSNNKADGNIISPKVLLTSNNVNSSKEGFYISEYFSQAECSDTAITEEVRNFWPQEPNKNVQMPPMLTMPGLQTEQDLPDEIAQAVFKYLGEAELQQRNLLTANNVTQDERGLRSLIEAGCYRAAINLTSRLLNVHGQGYGRAGQPTKHSPHSLQLWFTRLSLLIKIGAFELLQLEAEPFDQLQRPDIFYEFYPEKFSNKQGSIACFSFRLLLAELPIYSGNAQKALERLAKLCITCQQIREHYSQQNAPQAVQFWRKRELRVLYSIVNCAITLRQFNLVDDIINHSILSSQNLRKEERRMFFSAWGRVYLHIGDIFGAEQKFAEARRLRDLNSALDLQDLVDKGLTTMAKNDFPEAFVTFQKALQIDSTNTMILNNMGVCLLYAGKLKEAIKLFERAVEINLQKSLNENLLLNLSTLYELESNNSKGKKHKLLRLINRHKPDLRMSVEICLKLQVAT